MTRRWTMLAACVISGGCAIGPRYTRPPAETPDSFKELADNDQWKMATPRDDQAKGAWWEIFGDPELNALESLVEINNQNVKQAQAQFREARAAVLGNRANAYPLIGVSPAITKTATGANGGRGVSASFTTFSLPADVSWEPDLWGRVRLAVEGAVGAAQVSAADLENIRLSEQALLAADYFALAA